MSCAVQGGCVADERLWAEAGRVVDEAISTIFSRQAARTILPGFQGSSDHGLGGWSNRELMGKSGRRIQDAGLRPRTCPPLVQHPARARIRIRAHPEADLCRLPSQEPGRISFESPSGLDPGLDLSRRAKGAWMAIDPWQILGGLMRKSPPTRQAAGVMNRRVAFGFGLRRTSRLTARRPSPEFVPGLGGVILAQNAIPIRACDARRRFPIQVRQPKANRGDHRASEITVIERFGDYGEAVAQAAEIGIRPVCGLDQGG